MFDLLKNIFAFEPETNSESTREHQSRLAAAALLVEVANIDSNFSDVEHQTMMNILETQFDLSSTEVEELQQLARQEQASASSLYEFTSLVNENFSNDQKFELIINMWEVAFADGEIDKYEEYIIRRVAELIYLAHNDFIRAKQIAREKRFN
ncbi:tellurite resistance TerB family protein [Sessilibacter sp. MAH2]